eukprot:1150781-Pelagomonas_calceolata.AAC.8
MGVMKGVLDLEEHARLLRRIVERGTSLTCNNPSVGKLKEWAAQRCRGDGKQLECRTMQHAKERRRQSMHS